MISLLFLKMEISQIHIWDEIWVNKSLHTWLLYLQFTVATLQFYNFTIIQLLNTMWTLFPFLNCTNTALLLDWSCICDIWRPLATSQGTAAFKHSLSLLLFSNLQKFILSCSTYISFSLLNKFEQWAEKVSGAICSIIRFWVCVLLSIHRFGFVTPGSNCKVISKVTVPG